MRGHDPALTKVPRCWDSLSYSVLVKENMGV